jgi:hypothetical protein
MALYGMTAVAERHSSPIAEDLAHLVDSRTQWQIHDLDIDCDGSRVIVTGRCRTWYLKQLVTHAIRSAEPDVDLWNEIIVEES